MENRVKELRNKLGLSQTTFGSSLGVSRDVINNIENNRVPLKSPLAKLIVNQYKVDPYWLETGKGDMFLPQTKDDAIASFMASVLADEEESFRRRFVEMLASLDDRIMRLCGK